MDNTKKSPGKAFKDSLDATAKRIEAHYDQIESASKLLPAWFVPRMMDDVWQFGLMLSTGATLGISRIIEVSQDAAGGIWIDAEMLTIDPGQASGFKITTAPIPERPRCSLNAAHVMAAFEIAFT